MAAEVLLETFVQGSTAIIILNFSAKNPPHRQAEKRWQIYYDETTKNHIHRNNYTFCKLRKGN
ncbi:hypothetical protein Q361_1251 [Flavobacterium croceum DSM 17960]|uniref:Uncharacterized protein n=1 Tax=Flavobacterium croceum DSM 17960 TaxID=1121886 RepID=A0A2S4N509_9FLAO|nr:hypothetical protein Q361_1251 [Flavobacterium croceum DSM 17960]